MGFVRSQNTQPEQLLALALDAGAEVAEVFQSRVLSRPVYFEANRLKQLESSEVEGIALRLWHQGKPGLAVAYGQVDPQVLVAKAMALSHLNSAETAELTVAEPIAYADVGQAVDVKTLVSWGQDAIEQGASSVS